MQQAKEIKHILISLYCRSIGGSADELEVWDGSDEGYVVMRKSDGWISRIPRDFVGRYLSHDKSVRKDGETKLIECFYNFREPEEN